MTKADDFLSIKDARDFIPGRPVESTIGRWIDPGLQDGKLKLEVIRVGGRLFVTKAAIAAFLAKQNAPGEAAAADELEDAKRRGREASQALEKLGC